MYRMFLKCVLVTSFFAMGFVFPALEAGGWGKTEATKDFEKCRWNEVYFDMNDCFFRALLPNYTSAEMRNMDVSFFGQAEGNAYAIIIGLNEDFPTPKSQQEFLKIVEKANPDHQVVLVEVRKSWMKFAVDLTPKTGKENTYWRMIAGKNRLVKMGTIDSNASRRKFFFESLKGK